MSAFLRRIETVLMLGAVAVVLGLGAWIALVLTAAGADIRVTSVPAGASVEVDGNFRGTTPLKLRDLPIGPHVLRLTRHGFQPLLEKVRLEPGYNAVALELAPQPPGVLEIVSRPPGADVFLDGQPRGVTPLVLTDVSVGEREIRLSLVNYLDQTQVVEVPRDRKCVVEIALVTRTEDFYLKKIAADPKSAEHCTDLAHYYILQHEWKKAEDRYEQALYLVANESQSANYAGRLLAELQKVMQEQFDYGDEADVKKGRVAAVNALERAMERTPTWRHNYDYGIAFALWAGDVDRGARLMEKGIVAFPRNLDWLGRATSPWAQKDVNELVQQFQQRVSKDPEDFARRFMLCAHIRLQGQAEQAATELGALAAMAKDPRAASILWEDLGDNLRQRREYDRAAEAYARAVDVQPEPERKASLQYKCIGMLKSAGKAEQLCDAWKRAVELQQDFDTANRWRISWAQACIDAGRKNEARRILEELIKLAAESPNTVDHAQNLLKRIQS